MQKLRLSTSSRFEFGDKESILMKAPKPHFWSLKPIWKLRLSALFLEFTIFSYICKYVSIYAFIHAFTTWYVPSLRSPCPIKMTLILSQRSRSTTFPLQEFYLHNKLRILIEWKKHLQQIFYFELIPPMRIINLASCGNTE